MYIRGSDIRAAMASETEKDECLLQVIQVRLIYCWELSEMCLTCRSSQLSQFCGFCGDFMVDSIEELYEKFSSESLTVYLY